MFLKQSLNKNEFKKIQGHLKKQTWKMICPDKTLPVIMPNLPRNIFLHPSFSRTKESCLKFENIRERPKVTTISRDSRENFFVTKTFDNTTLFQFKLLLFSTERNYVFILFMITMKGYLSSRNCNMFSNQLYREDLHIYWTNQLENQLELIPIILQAALKQKLQVHMISQQNFVKDASHNQRSFFTYKRSKRKL